MLITTAVALVVGAVGLWVVSVLRRDVSVVDIGWPIGFVVVAAIAGVAGDGSAGRRLLLAGLVTVWGLRLAVHLVVRKVARPGEDPRYAAIRGRHGPRFRWTSLGIVFLFQAAVLWVISLPVQAGAAGSTRPLGPLDLLGVLAWAVGLGWEAVGDEQLRRFRADPAHRGQVLDRGLWRFTRHPNYFGECLLWWGVYLVAVSAGAWWAAVGPLLLTWLLLRVSGVRLLEEALADRPGYADYVGRTSSFVPRPPRRSSR